jgi:hypothetical protein
MDLTLAEINHCESTIRADISDIVQAATDIGVTTMDLETKSSTIKKLVMAQITSLNMFDECSAYIKIAYMKGLKPRDIEVLIRCPYENVKYCLTQQWKSKDNLTKLEIAAWDYKKTIQDQTTRFTKDLRKTLEKYLSRKAAGSDAAPVVRKYSNLTPKFLKSRGYSNDAASLYHQLPMAFADEDPKLLRIIRALSQYFNGDEESDESDTESLGNVPRVSQSITPMPVQTRLYNQSDDVISRRKRVRESDDRG